MKQAIHHQRVVSVWKVVRDTSRVFLVDVAQERTVSTASFSEELDLQVAEFGLEIVAFDALLRELPL